MLRLIVSTGVAILALTSSAQAATLNKCIDARGKITYSNLPCHNAREARALEIDPAPLPEPVRAQPAPPAAAKPAANRGQAIRFETQRTSGKPAPHASSRQCDALSEKLGRVFDRMDQARRKGYTQEQTDAWSREVKDLERKKQQSGCF